MRKIFLLSMIALLYINVIIAQTDRTITGKVTDDKGAAIPDASVVVKGISLGTTTSNDGTFTLKIPAAAKTLVISSLNFISYEITIGNKITVFVTLKSATNDLSEVVVTSFGIKRDKKTLGYSTPTIKSEDLTAVRNSNVSNSLVGKVAGVRTQGSGGSFTGSAVLIRGYTSITGASAPLYVIDGMPINNGGGGTALQTGTTTSNRVVDINPDDVAEMTILKGAAATSLYGSRGAGGVILITTKKGNKKTKNTVDITSSYSMINVNRFPEYQNLYSQGVGGNYVNNSASSWGVPILGQSVTNFYGQPETLQAYPNNVKDLFSTGYSMQNSISVNGGNDKTTYRISYSNTKETYVLKSNELNKNSLTVNLNSDITSKLTVGTSLSFNNTASVRTQQGNQLSNPLFRAWFTPRSYNLSGLPYYDANGNQLYYGTEDNPYWAMENIRYNDDLVRFFGNTNVKYKFNSWLNADFKIGGDFYSFKSHGYDQIGMKGQGNVGSSATNVGGIRDSRTFLKNFNSYFTINANKRFGDFNISGTLGNEIFDNYSNTVTVSNTTLLIKDYDNIANATVVNTPAVGTTQTRTIGVFGDVSIDYKKYLSLNIKARNDWPSVLPVSTRSIFYPAASLSFLLTEALPSLRSDLLNAVKIRANYGKVGNGPGAYNTDNYAGVGSGSASDGFGPAITYPYNGLVGYTISNGAGNPKLKPEFTTEWELGTDISLFKNRLTLEANYYQRKLTDGLFSVPVSPASGVTSVYQNAGEIETKGFELSFNIIPVQSKNFTWSLSGNYTQFKSVVTKLAPGVSVITLAGFTTPNIRLVEGEQFGVIYGNMYNRDASGRVLLNASGLPTPTSGVFKIGNPNPKFTMGITNTFSYKNLTLDFLVDIRKGGDLYSRNLADLRRNGVVAETAELPRFAADNITLLKNYSFDGVDASGNKVNVPLTAEQYWGNTGKYVAAEGFIVNTSWVRLRELNLMYKLPKSILSKSPFGNVEVGVYGRNLFLIAPDYPHLDPEQNVLGASNFQGLEFNANASTRTIGISLRVTL